MYLHKRDKIKKNCVPFRVPLLCVLAFTVAFSLGISPISWLLVAELFPLEHRGLGTAMATSFSYLCAFVGVKTFVDFQDLFGLHGAFWLYAALSVCGLCFVVCLVPETKGQNLIEMNPKHLAAAAAMTQATTVRWWRVLPIALCLRAPPSLAQMHTYTHFLRYAHFTH